MSVARQKLFRFLDKQIRFWKYRNNVRELTPAILAVLPLEYRGYRLSRIASMSSAGWNGKGTQWGKTGCHSQRTTPPETEGNGVKVLCRCSCGPGSSWSINGDVDHHAGAIWQVQNGESRSAGTEPTLQVQIVTHLIAGGIMANTAEIFNFPVPDVAQSEPRVADLGWWLYAHCKWVAGSCDAGRINTAPASGSSSCQRAKHMVLIKTGLGEQRATSELTGILPHKRSAAKDVLVKRGIFIQSGREYRH